jgi:hypothetical protein
MPKKVDTESFKEKVREMYGDEYTVLSPYVNVKTNVLIRHNSDNCDNFTYEISPNHFLSGRTCRKCYAKRFKSVIVPKKRTTEEFKKSVYDLVGDEYKVLGEYEGSRKQILLEHNAPNCKCTFYVTPENFLIKNRRCPICTVRVKGTYKRRRKLPSSTAKRTYNRTKINYDNPNIVDGFDYNDFKQEKLELEVFLKKL